MRSHSSTHPPYRADIDGLRAVAVLLVIGFHAFPRLIPGGFVGVDIFFVISGFLISSIVFGNLERGSFSYADFYARRIRRIFPALIVVLFATLAFGWYVLLSDEFGQLGKHIAAGAGFVSNLVLWNESGYFDTDTATKPLLHLWSLGVEEQFYIVWPLLLGLVWKHKHNFLWITLLVALLSFADNLWAVHHNIDAAYYSPLSRFWELMIGGILAYLTLHKPNVRLGKPNWQAPLGLVLIATGAVLLDEKSAFPGWWALLPTLGAFFIISAGPAAWLNRHLLGNRLMVWTGLISYPLYLWHWPIFSYALIVQGHTPSVRLRLAAVAVTFVLAWLTYGLLEKPIKKHRGPVPVAVLAGLAALLFCGGLLVWQLQTAPRNSGQDLQQAVLAARDGKEPLKSWETGDFKGQTLNSKQGDAPGAVLFLGDSHMQQYRMRVDQLIADDPRHSRSVVFMTEGGCPPIPGVSVDTRSQCIDWQNRAIELARSGRFAAVTLAACWNCYFTHAVPVRDRFYFDVGDTHTDLKTPAGAALAWRALEQWLATLTAHVPVFLVLDNPNGLHYAPQSFIMGTRLKGLRFANEGQTRRLTAEQAAVRDTLLQIAARTHAIAIDPVATLCHDGECATALPDGSVIYRDRDHLRGSFIRSHATFMDITVRGTGPR